mmetsp:Transcript_13052/g.20513  ORF Transcript_13052/g.20513 Transcript_13052/m.20513 type:complete len:207 (+) Transcript_13052:452-1072(+)
MIEIGHVGSLLDLVESVDDLVKNLRQLNPRSSLIVSVQVHHVVLTVFILPPLEHDVLHVPARDPPVLCCPFVRNVLVVHPVRRPVPYLVFLDQLHFLSHLLTHLVVHDCSPQVSQELGLLPRQLPILIVVIDIGTVTGAHYRLVVVRHFVTRHQVKNVLACHYGGSCPSPAHHLVCIDGLKKTMPADLRYLSDDGLRLREVLQHDL